MHDLQAQITRIEAFVDGGSIENLTFAALLCRLAIEQICYERLRNAHDYISHDDLKRWQPRDIVNKLIQEVDPHIASEYSISVSKAPDSPERPPPTLSDFEAKEYFELGRQVGFDANKLGRLWNGLGSFLHVRLPRTQDDTVSLFGSLQDVRRKVEEALAELRRLQHGTLISGGLGEIVRFECNCDTENKRRASLLKNGQVVSCVKPDCDETWTVEIEGTDIGFHRRSIAINCQKCDAKTRFPEKPLLALKRNQMMKFICTECDSENHFMWKLMQAKPRE